MPNEDDTKRAARLAMELKELKRQYALLRYFNGHTQRAYNQLDARSCSNCPSDS